MKTARALYDALRAITKADDDILPAIVKTVNSENTIDAEYDELLLKGCRLQSKSEGTEGQLLIPAIDSIVLLKRIGQTNEFYVCMTSELQEMRVDINTATFSVKGNGHLIKKDNDTLKQALTLIIEAVQQVVVLNGNNPNYIKLTEALTKINNILR